jgi:hypothetical protein
MATRQLPDAETLRKLLRYEPETGKLYWLPRPVEMFTEGRWNSAYRKCCSWNGKNAGREALSSVNGEGYLTGAIFGRPVKAHRVAWALITGEWPDKIDHISGDRSDNRWQNLRTVDDLENSRNRKVGANNRTGCSGVGFQKRNQKWRARISANGNVIWLGQFDSYDEAVTARKAAERQHGYHPNHGRRV